MKNERPRGRFLTPTGDAYYWHEIDSPVGTLLLAGDGLHLRRVHFQCGPQPLCPQQDWVASRKPFEAAIMQLREYFAGRRREFDLPLAPGGTDFQRQVWYALGTIPYGRTVSYGEIARRVGNPRASRAVGLANGANPLPIIVPCHRVIGMNGSLAGFGGGVQIKRALLALEDASVHVPPEQLALWSRARGPCEGPESDGIRTSGRSR